MPPFVIPESLADSCRVSPQRRAWLAALPHRVAELAREWALTIAAPFDAGVTCSWVAPAERNGVSVVLKIGMPHMEGDHEIAGLRFWSGDGVVRLLAADESRGAMLLERCVPGTSLRAAPEPDQDVVIASLLRRLWRAPGAASPFRPLSTLVAAWREEAMARVTAWRDAGLVRDGLEWMQRLASDAVPHVLLATDLHAGNVLRAEREPWLAIDPKPFVGDPAFDATQHLLNCRERVARDARGTIGRFADGCGVDADRVRRWLFARVAAEPRTEWTEGARRLARRLGG